jgi:hypothetical protein
MVLVHIEITASGHFQIERPVARYQFQHVVQESDAGGNPSAAAAVEVEPQADVGLARPAVHLSLSHSSHFFTPPM